MGSRGPVPKRSDQRRRTNKKPQEVTTADGAAEVEIPEVDPEWHPVARQWFESLARSGQSRWYEPSDWATAVVVAESMSRELHPQGLVYKGEVVSYHSMTVKAASLSAWLTAASSLLVTEGDRRRLSMELRRPAAEEGDDDVAWLDDARRRLRESG